MSSHGLFPWQGLPGVTSPYEHQSYQVELLVTSITVMTSLKALSLNTVTPVGKALRREFREDMI